jgi:hypothetical protein
MAIMRVPIVELLRQVVMGWIHYSSTCCHVRVGACSHVMSYQALNAAAS